MTSAAFDHVHNPHACIPSQWHAPADAFVVGRGHKKEKELLRVLETDPPGGRGYGHDTSSPDYAIQRPLHDSMTRPENSDRAIQRDPNNRPGIDQDDVVEELSDDQVNDETLERYRFRA